MRISITQIPRQTFLRRIDELVHIHIAAMQYPTGIFRTKRQQWIESSSQPHFIATLALAHPHHEPADPNNPEHRCVAVAYCFDGTPGSWWHQQVRLGLAAAGHSPSDIDTIMSNYAELAEVHVIPQLHGKGIGKELTASTIAACQQPTLLLSTPEVPQSENAAWNMYRSLGFEDLLRNFYFSTDPRAFGILRLQR